MNDKQLPPSGFKIGVRDLGLVKFAVAISHPGKRLEPFRCDIAPLPPAPGGAARPPSPGVWRSVVNPIIAIPAAHLFLV
jgi:hypothetical protein